METIKVRDVDHHDGDFNIITKVLRVKKTFALGEASKKKVEFEGGDETGTAIFVVNALRFIKAGAVMMISRAKVYSFHGTRQIQQQHKNSHL